MTCSERVDRIGCACVLASSTRATTAALAGDRPDATACPTAAAEEDLGPVLARLGGLPLALEQAAAWVTEVPNRSFARFVELYNKAASDPFPDGTRPRGYEHTATTTWRISIEAAAGRAPLARRLLTMMAFFAPDEIPCQWLRDLGDDDADLVEAALDALHRYSLVTITARDTASMHRLVQAVSRRTASVDAAAAAIRVLRRQAPGDGREPSSWSVLARMVPHALSVAATASCTSPLAADCERLLGLEHPLTLTVRGNLDYARCPTKPE